MLLTDLPEDVLLCILSYLPFHSRLLLARTCHSLWHFVTFTPSTWRSLHLSSYPNEKTEILDREPCCADRSHYWSLKIGTQLPRLTQSALSALLSSNLVHANLQHLCLAYHSNLVTDSILLHLRSVPLVSLDLRYCTQFSENVFLQTLSSFSSTLERLSVAGCWQLPSMELWNIRMEKLQELDVRGLASKWVDLDTPSTTQLRDWWHCFPELKKLLLVGDSWTMQNHPFAMARFPLHDLVLSFSDLDQAIPVIECIHHNELTSLYLNDEMPLYWEDRILGHHIETGNNNPFRTRLDSFGKKICQLAAQCGSTLRSLQLINLNIRNHHLIPLSHQLSHLKELNLSQIQGILTDGDISSALPQLNHLTSLILSGHDFLTNAAIDCIIEYCPKLERVHLSKMGPGIKRSGVAQLIYKLTSLKELEMNNCEGLQENTSDRNQNSFAFIEKNESGKRRFAHHQSQLEVVSFQNVELEKDALPELLACLPHLKWLSCRLKDVSSMKELPLHCPKLVQLYVHMPILSTFDSIVKPLNRLIELQSFSLTLRNNNVTSLTKLRTMPLPSICKPSFITSTENLNSRKTFHLQESSNEFSLSIRALTVSFPDYAYATSVQLSKNHPFIKMMINSSFPNLIQWKFSSHDPLEINVCKEILEQMPHLRLLEINGDEHFDAFVEQMKKFRNDLNLVNSRSITVRGMSVN